MVDTGVLIEVTGNVLLFLLVLGMSATVDIRHLKTQIKNVKAILSGLFLQFVVMPLLGFFVVKTFQMDHPTGVMLLVVTSSPGGSYSNWWCSMFNADLALSVTMTAFSTVASAVMLPLNLLMYARSSYNDDVVDSLDWGSLAFALLIVIVAIVTGLCASAYAGSNQDFRFHANWLGNISGILLVLFSFSISAFNSDKDARIWNREIEFYAGVALPCLMGLVLANLLTTALQLWHPERVTVSIECCYQNVGIATSVALSMFRGEDRAEAVAVPFFYGLMEAVFLLAYCVGAWKLEWTKAPKDVNFFTMLFTSYEVLLDDDGHNDRADKDDDGKVVGNEPTPDNENDYYMIDYKDAEASAVQK